MKSVSMSINMFMNVASSLSEVLDKIGVLPDTDNSYITITELSNGSLDIDFKIVDAEKAPFVRN